MHVQLLSYTGMPDSDHAINLLIFTKQTRLQMSPGFFQEIEKWPYQRKLEELEYMANTIPSSWEFVSYTWLIEGVSRAFTHQFVRSRQFSFAQQTMRVLDVSSGPGWDYLSGPSLEGDCLAIYQNTMKTIDDAYKHLIRGGAKIEDARGILPTNILTNIVGSCNMRSFIELVQKRSSPRTQNEYRDVLEAMKASVLEVHPWMSLFLDRTFDRAASDLDKEISEIDDGDKRTRMVKLVDQLRAKQ
jgi:thymidylate synthase (FAD)